MRREPRTREEAARDEARAMADVDEIDVDEGARVVWADEPEGACWVQGWIRVDTLSRAELALPSEHAIQRGRDQ